ncbi:hypothetical protein VNO78_12495 [Psophocarpus tetragonolobus]|uniref:Uncharacterized protein n=1 Tax=Psophocarpus tetragonolobus TaxID=3891 RepID=A0AAN9SQW0_PSOTE
MEEGKYMMLKAMAVVATMAMTFVLAGSTDDNEICAGGTDDIILGRRGGAIVASATKGKGLWRVVVAGTIEDTKIEKRYRGMKENSVVVCDVSCMVAIIAVEGYRGMQENSVVVCDVLCMVAIIAGEGSISGLWSSVREERILSFVMQDYTLTQIVVATCGITMAIELRLYSEYLVRNSEIPWRLHNFP